MEVEYKWLKHELNSAIGTIKTEKTVSSELNDVLAAMETQLANLKDQKMIDLGELRGGDPALISQTIMAKKTRMTTAIGRLQEELELVSSQNKELRNQKEGLEKNLVEIEEKYANCTVDLMDVQNNLQSEILAHKVKCCNYEDEVAYHYRLLSHSSDAVTKLCGNANRYIAYYKSVRGASAAPVKGVSSLASVIAKADFDLIEHKCQVLGFKALYKTVSGFYKTVMHSTMRKWSEATVAARVREKVLWECAEDHEGRLSELSAAARAAHEKEVRDLKHHYEQIISRQAASITRLEKSRQEAVRQLYCNAGENVLESNVTHNLNIRRSKRSFKNNFFEKWLSLAFKSYLCKHEAACTEIEELKRRLSEMDQKYLDLFNESASSSEARELERRRHALHVAMAAVARRHYFTTISLAFRSWSDQLREWKHRQVVLGLEAARAELLESCHALSEELTALVGTHNTLVRHNHYVEVANVCLSRQHQALKARLLKREMLERWRAYHFRCLLLKYKCKSENYPNLRRLAQSALIRTPAPPPPVIQLPPRPPSPEVVVLTTPAPAPRAPRPSLFVAEPFIVQETPDVITYRYRK